MPSRAAGVAGVIKMVLALQHEVLPRTLHADEPSPHVDWSAGQVRLLTEPVPGPRTAARGGPGCRRSASAAPTRTSSSRNPRPLRKSPRPRRARFRCWRDLVPWVVSGRTAAGLAAQAGRLAAHVTARPELVAADVAWSLATTRSVFEHRAVVLGAAGQGLAAGLAAVAAGQPGPGVITGAVPAGGAGRVVFVFPGQGSQWAGMGRELAGCCPVFAARLAECGAALAPHVDWDLEEVLAGRRARRAWTRRR